jgi:hypothetical protein
VLTGGRNSGQKAQQGPGKKELAGRIHGRYLAEFRPNFGRNLPKVAEKGPTKIF